VDSSWFTNPTSWPAETEKSSIVLRCGQQVRHFHSTNGRKSTVPSTKLEEADINLSEAQAAARKKFGAAARMNHFPEHVRAWDSWI
jgi:hypothetical protein